MKCSLCEDCGWVCESHPGRPWEGERACTCGDAGARRARSATRATTNPHRGRRRGSGPNSTRRDGVISDRGWKRSFDDPIPLPRGRQLVTLQDAGSYITKLPRSEHTAPEWQAAMEALILVA
jgi:hypothetical protein